MMKTDPSEDSDTCFAGICSSRALRSCFSNSRGCLQSSFHLLLAEGFFCRVPLLAIVAYARWRE